MKKEEKNCKNEMIIVLSKRAPDLCLACRF